MTEVINWIFIFLGLYWAFCLFWGVRASRQITTTDDYFLSSRNTSPWVFALAATAISFAGWIFIAHPGLVFRDGFSIIRNQEKVSDIISRDIIPNWLKD